MKTVKDEFLKITLTKKGMEFAKQTSILCAYLTHNDCPHCGVKSYKENDGVCIPYDYDFKRKACLS